MKIVQEAMVNLKHSILNICAVEQLTDDWEGNALVAVYSASVHSEYSKMSRLFFFFL